MKINKFKINSYGKLKEKEIDLKDGINIIYGKNESGKSTLINFIINSFYGISKNKDGKDISDFDKYKPWVGEEFSGKIEYELDNGKKFEIYRDFNKKSPKIFNENMEDISKEFNINKNKENEFFYEQTNIDKDLFLSTLAINQNEVRLKEQEQNILMQKVANLAQTGNDSVSFKKVIDRINRRQLDEIGTERSREKPINILNKKIKGLEEEKENLEKYKDFKYNFEDEEGKLSKEISALEKEYDLAKEMKAYKEKQRVDEEKIKIKLDIEKENLDRIGIIEKQIQELGIDKGDSNNNKEERKSINRLNIALVLLIIINITQFILIKENIFKYIFLITIPVFLVYYFYMIQKQRNRNAKNKRVEKKNIDDIKIKRIGLENEKKILEDNIRNIDNEISELKININRKNNTEIDRIKYNYISKIDSDKISDIINLNELSDINFKIDKIQSEINDKKVKLHSLDLDKQNIEPQLDNLSKIEEELLSSNDKMRELVDLNMSMDLAKEVLKEAYEKMKNSVTPRFTENLSKNISSITNKKYNKVKVNDEQGLIVELDNGDNVPANRLSVGTIDQLYLSLRLSMIDELSEEVVPIFLDEAFAFYDNERLENILLYLNNNFNNRQIVIFTCTNREKEILENNNIDFSYCSL